MVRVRLFAALREMAATQVEVEAATAGQVVDELRCVSANDSPHWRAAVPWWWKASAPTTTSRSIASEEVALLPPVSGG